MGRWSLILISIYLSAFSLFAKEAPPKFLFHEAPVRNLPVLFQGRFCPADAAAHLWLFEVYKKRDVPSWHHQSIHGTVDTPLGLQWKMHFLGHEPWNHAPLLGVKNHELRSVLDLDHERDHFSYHDITNIFHENRKINLRLIKRLIQYQFAIDYHKIKSARIHERLELTNLSPGLWVRLKDKKLIVVSAPKTDLWKKLRVGMEIPIPEPLIHQGLSKLKKEFVEAFQNLNYSIQQYEQLTGPVSPAEKAMEKTLKQLQLNRMTPNEISKILEAQHSLRNRLEQGGHLLRVLPNRHQSGNWLSLQALKVQVYDQKKNKLVPVSNFTPYSDEAFAKIRNLHNKLETAVLNLYQVDGVIDIQNRDTPKELKVHKLTTSLSELLLKEYKKNLSKTVYREAEGKHLFYPSTWQLKAENLYEHYPFQGVAIGAYAIALLIYFLAFSLKAPKWNRWAILTVTLAFSLHTLILIIRCYILNRPPVANMIETAIYVPWVAVCASFILRFFLKSHIVLIASSLASLTLLSIISMTQSGRHLENVQAVLDSQYWLIIHVLMVVGSYGVFVLNGILGHIYLFLFLLKKKHHGGMRFISRLVLQTIYLGTALLIPGTILGGIWAAESWGRFWDWDPKESWAFISSCMYLAIIHAYNYRYIGPFGLALGALLGLSSITFTWYGVNYILGSGLHSYGFGNGGEIFYYLFLFIEFNFIIYALIIRKKIYNRELHNKRAEQG